jgi:hypothetical protein
MATIIRGLLAQDLPWGLVFVGMAIAVVVELCGVRSLSFAVGAYLPLSTTMPIFIGGALKGLIEKKTATAGAGHDSDVSPGMLYSTGLVAGGSLTGVAIALLTGVPKTVLVDGVETRVPLLAWVLDAVGIHGFQRLGGWADVIGIAAFGALGFLLMRAARERLET